VASAGKGSLDVQSTPPGAEILVNGEKAGQTPKLITGLDASKPCFVVLKKAGYKKFIQGVKFDASARARLAAALVAEGGSAPPRTEAKPEPDAGKAAPPPAGAKGFLLANTKPWARVIVDGKDSGMWTPIPPAKAIPLAPGPHKITFKTQDGKSMEVPVTIEAGKTQKLIKEFPP
jgi:hypothetical protein